MKKMLLKGIVGALFVNSLAFAEGQSEILAKVLVRNVLTFNILSDSESDTEVLARKNLILSSALEGQEGTNIRTTISNIECDSAMGGRQHCLISINKEGVNPDQPSGSTIALDVYLKSGEVVFATMIAVAGGGI